MTYALRTGSECFAALEAGDRAKADRIYAECEVEHIVSTHGLSRHDAQCCVYECHPNGMRVFAPDMRAMLLRNRLYVRANGGG